MSNAKKLVIFNEIKALRTAISRLKRVESNCVTLPDDEVTKVKLIELITDENLILQKEIEVYEKALDKK